MHLVVGGRAPFDELRHAIGTTAVHPVEQQAAKMYVQVGGRPKALGQRDGAAVAFVGLELGTVQQMARDHALHHLQHRRDQLGLRGQQQALRDR
jgi:hypothetical protein